MRVEEEYIEGYCRTMSNTKKTDSNLNDEALDSLAELARKKYLYRKLVMNGRAKMPARLAMKMVGPDCAFHLYRNHGLNSPEETETNRTS